MSKLAILDTDFISKGHIFRISEDDHLVDCVLKLPDYSFFCHEQTIVELGRHSTFAPVWLEMQIQSGKITKYSDARLLCEMKELYFKACFLQYTNMLRTACDAFDKNYFKEHFGELDKLDHLQVSMEEYLQTIKRLDMDVGEGKNLGEIKEYVLLQWLNTQNEEPVFYFCSDDRNARNGVLTAEAKVQCVSAISAFQWLKEDGVFTKETAKPYFDSAIHFYHIAKQTDMRVVEASNVGRFVKIPYEQVFRDIFDGRFEHLSNGMLKYRSEEESES